ncbi:5-formyltetrahydrofolate cyclo-ligase [Kineococcus sp. LSe6-4]|uniref:5-formyltetrahydrofolate cyclo-ligase n=1 Tax=Kineococcus halophytocola TaxID=3234027 RepID=A0ABV4H4Y3_9ACTN
MPPSDTVLDTGPDPGADRTGGDDLDVRADLSLAPDVLAVEAHKRALRRDIRARRRRCTAQDAAAVDAAVAHVLLDCPLLVGVTRVAAYTSLPGEPGTRTSLAELRRRDVEVLLPVLLPDDDLDWELGPAGPATGHLGVQAVRSADVVVVPALAVDTAGRRLGQGGGSYDRALRRVPARVPVVAVVHDEELLDAAVTPLPALPHDRLVQAVVTPTRWLWLAA